MTLGHYVQGRKTESSRRNITEKYKREYRKEYRRDR